jgi:perosamine synthetase
MAMLRHLPPTAVPFSAADLRGGFQAGPGHVEAFAGALEGYLGVRRCYLASSGRTVLYLLLRGLARAGGDRRCEVVLPAYTCPSLARVILDLELRPRLVDISPETLGMDPVGLAQAIDDGTLAVIQVHPFGLPQATAQVLAWSEQAGAAVIEDAAQAMGARCDGWQVGTRGHFGLYSLGPGKPLSTAGGGVLSVNREEDMTMVGQWWRALPEASRAQSAVAQARMAAFNLAFHPRGWWAATRVGLHRAGDREETWGYRRTGLTPVQASAGLVQLPRLDAINQSRRRRAGQLRERLAGVAGIVFPAPVLVASEGRREQIFQALWAAGIGVGKMYRRALPDLFPELQGGHYPGADYVAHHLLTLPTHHYVADGDVQRMAEAMATAE